MSVLRAMTRRCPRARAHACSPCPRPPRRHASRRSRQERRSKAATLQDPGTRLSWVRTRYRTVTTPVDPHVSAHSMHTYIFTCMHVCVHTYTHTYIHARSSHQHFTSRERKKHLRCPLTRRGYRTKRPWTRSQRQEHHPDERPCPAPWDPVI